MFSFLYRGWETMDEFVQNWTICRNTLILTNLCNLSNLSFSLSNRANQKNIHFDKFVQFVLFVIFVRPSFRILIWRNIFFDKFVKFVLLVKSNSFLSISKYVYKWLFQTVENWNVRQFHCKSGVLTQTLFTRYKLDHKHET